MITPGRRETSNSSEKLIKIGAANETITTRVHSWFFPLLLLSLECNCVPSNSFGPFTVVNAAVADTPGMYTMAD